LQTEITRTNREELEITALREDLYRRFTERGFQRMRGRRWFHGLGWTVFVQLLAGLRRALDLVAAALLFRLLSPVIILTFLILKLKGVPIKRTPRVGRFCEDFNEFSFALPDNRAGRLLTALKVHRLPVLLNIVRGQMSFIGPRAVSPGELSPRDRAARRRYDVRPGLIGLWWVRQRSNINFDSEAVVDGEYVEAQTIWGDLSLGLRALPAMLYGKAVVAAADSITILGIQIDNLTMTESVAQILALLDQSQPAQVCFVNADCANIAFRNADYRRVLARAKLTLADGIGMKLAGKLLANEIKQNVNGTDLFPRLCAALEGTGHGIFLLGGRPGVAEGVRDWIRENYPAVVVSGLHHGYLSTADEREVLAAIRESGASLLLVALGAPRQDIWINQHLVAAGVRVALGVGGLFDFYSGQTPRAPQWLREMGLEWFFRFYQEPGRMWRRYFVGNGIFLGRVFRERMKKPRPGTEVLRRGVWNP
jgi:N-acetylglucosaminyldiphosphoundecaprenol N-acetyl-beta-D-mannosaminyltransferase